MKIAKSILIQLGIFLVYFMFANLFLLNKQGGADLLFVALTLLCLAVHFVIALVRFIKNKNAELSVGWFRVFTVLLLGILFLWFVDDYLSLLK